MKNKWNISIKSAIKNLSKELKHRNALPLLIVIGIPDLKSQKINIGSISPEYARFLQNDIRIVMKNWLRENNSVIVLDKDITSSGTGDVKFEYPMAYSLHKR